MGHPRNRTVVTQLAGVSGLADGHTLEVSQDLTFHRIEEVARASHSVRVPFGERTKKRVGLAGSEDLSTRIQWHFQ